jgi:hypothetical protein
VPDSGSIYEKWVADYGPVFAIPSILGSSRLILADPQTITHSGTEGSELSPFAHLSDGARMCLGNVVSPAFLGLISAFRYLP